LLSNKVHMLGYICLNSEIWWIIEKTIFRDNSRNLWCLNLKFGPAKGLVVFYQIFKSKCIFFNYFKSYHSGKFLFWKCNISRMHTYFGSIFPSMRLIFYAFSYKIKIFRKFENFRFSRNKVWTSPLIIYTVYGHNAWLIKYDS
jgi:hypothetical protein